MPVIQDEELTFEVTVPVVIVGGGACGLMAALTLRKLGVDCVVLERDATPYGSTGMSYGAVCGAGTQLQARTGLSEDSPDKLAEDIMTITKGQTDATMAHVLAQEAREALDWLTEEQGFNLTIDVNWGGVGHSFPRLHATPNKSGEELMGMFLNAAERLGVDVLTGAHVTDLIANREGRVRGVKIARPDGDELIGCEQLIIATCGFGANEAMVASNIPRMKDATYYGHEGNHGEGITWGQALGAAVADMASYQALGSLSSPGNLVIPHALLINGGVQINANGERFEDENTNISGQALDVLDQPGGICWMVYDQKLHEMARANYGEYKDGEQLNLYKSADSWEDLAAQMKVPPEALAQTMAGVAQLKAENATCTFGRTFKSDEPLEAPFYACKVTGALFHTQGGLVIDAEARVLREDGTPLPNLTAGGGAVRSVSGPGEWGYLPGIGLATAVGFGARAAKTAAAALS